MADSRLSKTLHSRRTRPTGALASLPSISTRAWVQNLPADFRSEIMTLTRPRVFAEGQLLFAKGEEPEGLYYVESGEVRASSLNFEGKEVVMYFFEEGSWLGLISAFDGGTSPATCRAVGETHIRLVKSADLRTLLERKPAYYPHFTELLCQWLRITIEFIEDSVLLNLRARMVKRLLGMAEVYGKPVDNGILIDLHLPQDELGRMMGASRQSINKELKYLQNQGWIATVPGRVVLCEIEQLENFVNQHS